MGLPKFSVGYAGEFTPDEGWQGVKLGVSIPLWENRNRVKHARAEVAAAEQAMDDARLQYSARLEFLFEQCRELAGNISRYATPFFATSISCLRYANAGFAVSASRTQARKSDGSCLTGL